MVRSVAADGATNGTAVAARSRCSSGAGEQSYRERTTARAGGERGWELAAFLVQVFRGGSAERVPQARATEDPLEKSGRKKWAFTPS
jgi:hypothetical protein